MRAPNGKWRKDSCCVANLVWHKLLPYSKIPMSAPQEKKSSCLAIGGTGCLIIIIVLVAAVGVTWWKFGPQIQEQISAFQKDPERAAAMLIVEKHPDFEKISVDDTNRTVTFKIKSTGEVITTTFKALTNAKIVTVNGKTEIQNLDRVQPEGAAAPPAAPSAGPAPAPQN
jgi:hypothetical protein